MSETERPIGPPRKILLATDLSGRGDRALDRAALLAREWGAKLLAVHALQPDPMSGFGRHRDTPSWRRPADPAVVVERQIRRDLRSESVDLAVIVREGDPVEVILNAVQKEDADLVVLGLGRESSFGRTTLGSTVEHVIRRSPVPVLIVKGRPNGPYKHILVGTDFTEESRYGLKFAVAVFGNAAVTLIHAFDLPYKALTLDTKLSHDFRDMEKATITDFLDGAGFPAPVRARIHPLIEHGPPETMLKNYVEEKGADLTVIGALGRGALFHIVIGGNTPKIVDAVPSDVLVVRASRDS